MHRLHLLGRVDLTDAQGTPVRSVLAQPKRLGLLAFIALNSGSGGARRDEMLALFWPELDQDRARNALNKSVHFLRHALAEDAIESRTPDTLVVRADRIWCDAVVFDECVSVGNAAEALRLYAGDLLPAFFVDGSAGFDEWRDRARDRQRRAACDAARSLAVAHERLGLPADALASARRAAELAHDDERVLREQLALLDRLGDRAGALRAYETFARHVAAEFQAEPAAETQALMASIRDRVAPNPGQPVAERADTRGAPGQAPRRTGLAVTLSLVATLITVAWAPAPLRDTWGVIDWPNASRDRHVLVASVAGGDGAGHVAGVALERLGSRLQQSPKIVVPSLARQIAARRAAFVAEHTALDLESARHVALRLGIPYVSDGRLDRVGSRYSVVVRVLRAMDGTVIATASATAGEGEVLDRVDDLARLVARRLNRLRVDSVPRISFAAATPSLVAYTQLLESYHASDFAVATRHARAAVDADSAFASGWNRLAYLYYQMDVRDSALPLYRRALQHGARLTKAERLYIEGMMAFRTARHDSAVRLFDAAIIEDPTSGTSYHDRGMALRVLGRWGDATESFDRGVLWSTGATQQMNLNSLATALVYNRRVDSAERVIRRLRGPERAYGDIHLAIARGRWPQVELLARREAGNPAHSPGERAHALQMVASSLAARGSVRAARRVLDSAYGPRGLWRRPMDRAANELTMALASGIAPVAPVLPGSPDTIPPDRLMRALWYRSIADSASAAREVEALRRRPGTLDWRFPSVELLAASLRPGRPGDRAIVDMVSPSAHSGAGLLLGSMPLQRWLLADAYERLGQLDSAVAVFDLLARPHHLHFSMGMKLGFVHTFALRRLALLHERLGNPGLARRYWRQFIDAMSQADAELLPLVAHARMALGGKPLRVTVPPDRRTSGDDSSGLHDPGGVLVTFSDNGDTTIGRVLRELSVSIPGAIAREGLGEVSRAAVRRVPAGARTDVDDTADDMVPDASTALHVRVTCTGTASRATCRIDLLRMPAQTLRVSVNVTGDASGAAMPTSVTNRVLVALYMQRTWGDRPRWLGEYLPTSLAAARAFKEACCVRRDRRLFASAARLDPGWATPAALAAATRAAIDSSDAPAESVFAALARRPELPDGERDAVAAISQLYRLRRRDYAPERDAGYVYAIVRSRAAVNPEWWSADAAYLAMSTGHPRAAIAFSMYADSAVAPLGRQGHSQNMRAFALHQLGSYRDQLELSRQLAQLIQDRLISRTHEVMALAALGELGALRRRLDEWEATPEPPRGMPGSGGGCQEVAASSREWSCLHTATRTPASKSWRRACRSTGGFVNAKAIVRS